MQRTALSACAIALCGALALTGVGVLTAGTMMFTGLGRSAAGANAEGPGVAAGALEAAMTYSTDSTAASAASTNARAMAPSDARMASLRAAVDAKKKAKADVQSAVDALRSVAKEPIASISLLEFQGPRVRSVVMSGSLKGWDPLQVTAVKAGGVQRSEAQAPETELGMVMYSAAVPNAPAGKTWAVVVVYDGIRLWQPGWGPIRTAASWNGAGVVLLLIGGFGLFFAMRTRRRQHAEAFVAA